MPTLKPASDSSVKFEDPFLPAPPKDDVNVVVVDVDDADAYGEVSNTGPEHAIAWGRKDLYWATHRSRRGLRGIIAPGTASEGGGGGGGGGAAAAAPPAAWRSASIAEFVFVALD